MNNIHHVTAAVAAIAAYVWIMLTLAHYCNIIEMSILTTMRIVKISCNNKIGRIIFYWLILVAF